MLHLKSTSDDTLVTFCGISYIKQWKLEILCWFDIDKLSIFEKDVKVFKDAEVEI